jgi:hypothetical protein
MSVFNRTSPEDRAKREAERSVIIQEEIRQTRIRTKKERIEARGYTSEDSRVNDIGGYGVTIRDDGTVVAGDRDLGDYVEGPLVGTRATLETLEQARDRVTATRLIALGVLAFALKKHDPRRILALSGPNAFEAVLVVDGSQEVHLRQWVAWFNRQAALAEQKGAPPEDGVPA